MTDPKPPKKVPRFDRRRREYRQYVVVYRRLTEARGGVEAMDATQVLLADQIAEAAALRKGVWAQHFTESATAMTAMRAAELRQQWQEAALAVRHGVAALRALDPVTPALGDDPVEILERARKRALAGEAAAREAAEHPAASSPAPSGRA